MELSPTQKYLNPHKVFGEQTFDQYCARIPSFYFREGVPDDVIKNFDVVEKMMALSYFEYRLIDEAYAKALLSFEMAMSIRYKEFSKDNKFRSFNSLIIELSKLGLFETELEYLKHIKYMRNHFSHPTMHNFGGTVYWNRIEHISRLINEMYEDVNLRKKRLALSAEFNEQLKQANLEKFVVMEINGECTLLYSLQLLFVNNKRNPHTYLLACTPLFDLTIDDGSAKVPHIFKANLTLPELKNNCLTGISFSAKQKVSFTSANKHPEFANFFEDWNSEFSKEKTKIHFTHAIYFNIPEILVPELQIFQRS
ncbi:MAG: hypothetical protein U0X76_11745 [Bacteroidia bacterium]